MNINRTILESIPNVHQLHTLKDHRVNERVHFDLAKAMFLLPRKRRRSTSSIVPTNATRPHQQAIRTLACRLEDTLSEPGTPLSVTPCNSPRSSNWVDSVGVQSQLLSPVRSASCYTDSMSNASLNRTPRSKPRVPCRICGVLLSSASNRIRHERTKHPKPGVIQARPVKAPEVGHTAIQKSSTGPTESCTSIGVVAPELQTEPEPNVPGTTSSESSGQLDSGSVDESESSAPKGAQQKPLENESPSCTMDSDVSGPGAEHAPSDEPSIAGEIAIEHDSTEYNTGGAVSSLLVEMPIDGGMGEVNVTSESECNLKEFGECTVQLEADSGGQDERETCDMDIDSEQPGQATRSPTLLELGDEALQQACLPFLEWLCLPPMTPIEAMVKARRVKSTTQLQPIKLNLRFIFGLLYDRGTIPSLELEAVRQLHVCRDLETALLARNVGSARVHALFLLVKKVLVFLASQESRRCRQYIQPTEAESFVYVESVVSDYSHRRKQEARNRSLLGIHSNQVLQHAQVAATSTALSEAAFAMPSFKLKEQASTTTSPVGEGSHNLAVSTGSDAPTSINIGPHEPSANELTKRELKLVAAGTLAFLQQCRQPPYTHYMAHLVTATLCLGLAPRSQVLKQLRIGSTLVKEADGRYWVKILAELSKNGKATMFALPAQLTEPYDFYLSTVRPAAMTVETHDYVFTKKNGAAPRADFSDLTSLVTTQLIGRPVNAHAFRAAVITAFYQDGASQSDMNVLASIMAHDPVTARQFYFKPQMAESALQASQRVVNLLGLK